MLTNMRTDNTKKLKNRKRTIVEVKLVWDPISSAWVIPKIDQTRSNVDLTKLKIKEKKKGLWVYAYKKSHEMKFMVLRGVLLD